MLRDNPAMSNKALRKHLKKYLPHFKVADSNCLGNFRRWTLRFTLDEDQAITLEDMEGPLDAFQMRIRD